MAKTRIYIREENLDKLDKEELKRLDVHLCLGMKLKEILMEIDKTE